MRWHAVLLVAVMSTSQTARAQPFDPEAYEAALRGLEGQRLALYERYRDATSVTERISIRQRARRLVLTSITDRILPAWMGTPWGLGPDSTAIRPHQPGKVVGCS
jgi:hypothetical protein